MQEPTGVSQLVEHLFRHEAGIMVATLTRIFGIEHWNLAEDVVQEALALKTLFGFSVAEISHAFLTTEVAIAKRLTRAKQKIQEAQVPFEIPVGDELTRRLDSVLQSLYLLFNEGYKASTGENLVREELCPEAIRLKEFMSHHRAGNQPETHAS